MANSVDPNQTAPEENLNKAPGPSDDNVSKRTNRMANHVDSDQTAP